MPFADVPLGGNIAHMFYGCQGVGDRDCFGVTMEGEGGTAHEMAVGWHGPPQGDLPLPTGASFPFTAGSCWASRLKGRAAMNRDAMG